MRHKNTTTTCPRVSLGKVCTLQERSYVILPSTNEILNCAVEVHKTALKDYFLAYLAVELF